MKTYILEGTCTALSSISHNGGEKNGTIIKLSIGSSATSSLPSWPNGLPLLKVSKKNSGMAVEERGEYF